jgi:hypothetical protein
MNKAIIIVSLLVAGCSTTGQRMLSPYEVSIIPIDCLNRKELIAHLERQVEFGYQTQAKDADINVVKYKLWEVRTVCHRG